MEFIEKLINLIVENKDMPKVQVERELSPIIEIFIEDILKDGSKIDKRIQEGNYKLIATEFPLQSKTKENDKDTYRSTNIDYLLLNEKYNELYLVELKTDSKSFENKQFLYYKEIIENKKPAYELFEFLDELENKKYKYLTSYVREKMGVKEDENPFENIKKIHLVYIAPKKMFTKNWGDENQKCMIDLQEEENYAIINFSDFKKIDVKSYKKEWSIITKKIEELDKN